MKPSFKGKRSNGSSGGWKGGGKKFGGGGKPWKSESGDRGTGPAVMHMATCVECGASCQVPFKPNGRKPIFCSNCFKKDDDRGPKRFDRPSFNDRGPRDSGNNSAVEARLKAIEEKLDIIMELLSDE